MKKIVSRATLGYLAFLLSLSLVSMAQQGNPEVTGYTISNPLLQYDENGGYTANIDIVNDGNGPIPVGSIRAVISFPNQFVPYPQSAAAVTSLGFSWTYDNSNPGGPVLIGVNTAAIAEGSGVTITIGVIGLTLVNTGEANANINVEIVDGFETLVSGAGSNSLFASTSVIENPAPVRLVTFTANKEAQTAVLNWSTAEEVNSERFEVEHSLNGKQWRTIGTVAAKGHSQSTLWYSFVDTNPANGENLYRLRMVDRDRTHAYSPVRSLSFEIKLDTYLYPNPVAEKLLINIDDWGKVERVQVYSNSGKAVFETESAPKEGIDVKHLPAGLYLVRVTRTNGAVEAFKVVKN